MSTPFSIRPIGRDDIPQVLAFIRELARYEHLEHEVLATEQNLREALLGEPRYAEAIFACLGPEAVGFALFFHNFSTFKGRPGIHLEDLYVRPHARGQGIGRALLAWVARTALERRCARLDWAVLDWNTPSIAFYESLGAQPLDHWRLFRLTGAALKQLGAPSAPDS